MCFIHYRTMENNLMRNYLLVLLLAYTLASPYAMPKTLVYPKEYYKLPGQLIEQFRRFIYNMKNQGTIARNPGAGVFRYIHSLTLLLLGFLTNDYSRG